jgi:hypothetical protein
MSKNDVLLDQYKAYIETSENLLDRRMNTLKSYAYVLSGLLAVLSLALKDGNFSDIEYYLLFVISTVAILLCVTWCINITSFKQFSDAKFKVLHEIEAPLPFHCFEREWDLLGKGKDPKKYIKLTYLERSIPILMSVPFIFLATYSLFKIVGFPSSLLWPKMYFELAESIWDVVKIIIIAVNKHYGYIN